MKKETYKKLSKKIKQKNNNSKQIKSLISQIEYLPKIKMPPTSKILLWAVFVICLQIIWFVEHMVEITGDMSAMVALIGVFPTIISVAVAYYRKSTAENTEGGIVYETAMLEHIEFGNPHDRKNAKG